MRTLLLAAAACGITAASAASAQTFAFTTLDNPGDPTFNQLLGINDKGVIVGYYGSGGAGHPNIGYEVAPPYTTFLTIMQPGSAQTQVTGINNEGLTTGFWSDTNTGTDANFAFVRRPTAHSFTYVSAIDPKTASAPRISQALGINSGNVVAGFYNDAGGASHGYTYALPTAAYTAVNIGGAAAATTTAINDGGQTCGFFVTQAGKTLGFVRSASGATTSFAVPGAAVTQLFGINKAGVTVGTYVDGSNVSHGVYYTPSSGAYVRVEAPSGTAGTVLNGINDSNQLVGFYTDAGGNVHGLVVTVSP